MKNSKTTPSPPASTHSFAMPGKIVLEVSQALKSTPLAAGVQLGYGPPVWPIARQLGSFTGASAAACTACSVAACRIVTVAERESPLEAYKPARPWRLLGF